MQAAVGLLTIAASCLATAAAVCAGAVAAAAALCKQPVWGAHSLIQAQLTLSLGVQRLLLRLCLVMYLSHFSLFTVAMHHISMLPVKARDLVAAACLTCS